MFYQVISVGKRDCPVGNRFTPDMYLELGDATMLDEVRPKTSRVNDIFLHFPNACLGVLGRRN